MAETVTDNSEKSRFELHAGDELVAWAGYRPAGESVEITHTETAEGHEGEGHAGALIAGALERLRASGRTVIPTCPFAASYIRKHPDLLDVVAPEARDRLGE